MQIKVRNSDASCVQSTGVLASVEVQMLAANLEFKGAEAELTEKGETFFSDLSEQLGTLISFQITGIPDRTLKVLFCPHASTTARVDNIRPEIKTLPSDRANTIQAKLAEALLSDDGATIQDIATLGSAIGHYDQEVSGYVGARVAHIIYKIYDASFPPPHCLASDLYPFVGISEDAAA